MKQLSLNTLLALAFYLLPETALAAKEVSSTIQCSTVSGTRKTTHVPTTTKTVRSTVISSVTIVTTSTVTDTPAPTTVTDTATVVSSTTTTLPQNTDTITSTEVDTATSTTDAPTSTSTSVTTSTTTTTTTGTTTVATSAGFTPVSDTLAGPSAVQRDVVGFSRVKRGLGSSRDPSALHPERVKCLKVIYTTKKTTTTVAASSTVTSTASTPTSVTTSTTTEVVTQTTQPGDASTTITETSTVTDTVTSTPSTTVTSTATATETDAAPEATFYAQCASDNLADSAGGDDINFIYGNGDYSFAHNVTSSYACCVSCALDPDCAVSAYDASEGFCATADTADSTCTEGGEQFTAALGGPAGSGHTQTVSNGNCGYISAS